MSALGAVKREEEADEVYELSSSSTNSDDPRDGEELGKRGSPDGNPWGEGFLQKKQKVESADDSRLNAWGYEDLKNVEHRDLNIGHDVKSASSPVALPFFPQPSLDESARTRTNCKQFWKAGDYEGQPAVVMQQAGENSDYLSLLQGVLLMGTLILVIRTKSLPVENYIIAYPQGDPRMISSRRFKLFLTTYLMKCLFCLTQPPFVPHGTS